MTDLLDSFDHVTLAVNDLDVALHSYRQLLAAEPVWRGAHPELGTQAALFGLENGLLELVAPDAQAPEAEGLRSLLAERGEGLLALAFGTRDAAQAHAQLRARGVRAAPPADGSALGPDGQPRHYKVVELSPRATRELPVYVVERPDAATLRRPAPAPDALGAFDMVTLRTADPDAAIALYGQGLGIRLALDRELFGARMLFFRMGGVTLELITDSALGARDRFYGVTYRVRDIDAAHARLAAAGFTLSELRDGRKPGTRVFTVRDGTCGVPTLVIRDPARELSPG